MCMKPNIHSFLLNQLPLISNKVFNKTNYLEHEHELIFRG